ncbi:hypothetical protein XM25_07720 [Devosia sp. H5989]|nr:hypothetical protein XM25_07720 [Devosia sp. H5989]
MNRAQRTRVDICGGAKMTDRLVILTEQQDEWIRAAMQLWNETFEREKTAEARRGRIAFQEIWNQLEGFYTEAQKDQMLNLAADIALPDTFKKPAESPPGAS